MKDVELDILIQKLETSSDLTIADFDGAVRALAYLLPGSVQEDDSAPQRISTADGAVLVAANAYPDWAVHIQGSANAKNGHWQCTLRENDSLDNDAALGSGASPVLAQAIIAAVLRLSIILKKD